MNLQINDWPIRRFVMLVMSMLLLILGLSYLENLGIGIVIFKEIIGFILLTFIPGFIILRILRLHDLNIIPLLLFSVGLSLFYMMMLGVIVSITFPMVGILNPLSFNPLFISLFISLTFLLAIAFIRDRNFTPIGKEKDYYYFLNPYVLLSVFVLVLGIFGVYMVNLYDYNFFLMIFIFIISIIPIIIASRKVPSKLYPLIIFFLSLALLCHSTLFTNFLVGSDIFAEFYFANLISADQIWNPTLNHQANTALSVTLIPSFYKIISGLNILWYFKLVSNFFFALVPVGLYYMYNTSFKGGLSKTEKFFAVFFVISLWYFYYLITGVIRQELAEFFFVLLLIVIFTEVKKTDNISYNLIFIFFSISLIVSHYSIANLFLFFIIVFMVINKIFGHEKKRTNQFGLNYIALFIVLALSWNIFISSGVIFKGVVLMGNSIVTTYTDLFSPHTNVAAEIATSSSVNIAHIIYRYIFYFVLVCMAVGAMIILRNLVLNSRNRIINVVVKQLNLSKYNKANYGDNQLYEMFTLTNYSLLGFYIVIPLIGFQLGFDRVFHLTSLLLAPYFILGFKNIINCLDKIQNHIFKLKLNKNSINKILAIFLTILFLFNSGFIFELINDPFPNSGPLSLKNTNDPTQLDKERALYLKLHAISDSELKSAEWFHKYYDPQQNRIYTTFGSSELFVYGIFTPFYHLIEVKKITDIKSNGYFYNNLVRKIFNLDIRKTTTVTVNEINQTMENNQLDNYNKIYSDNTNDIYLIRL